MTSTSVPTVAVPPSVVILGADALLTALPATPTQLANACYAAGYEGVFPASWGDELVAAGCLKNLETRIGPAILCTCPLVREQLRGVAPLQRFQLHLVSPPVAAARYLRALCDDAPLYVTYVGDCPGADDASIDERASPSEFLRRLAERGITPSTQRPDLGSNVPRDRRRFYSLPGGAPTPEWLSADWPKRTLVDVEAGDALADLAHHALERESTLIDFAPQLGCACSGALGGVAPAAARRAVAALEPPRARQEVLDPDLKVVVEAQAPPRVTKEEVSWDAFLASLPRALTPEAGGDVAAAPPEPPPALPPRRSREVPSGARSSSAPRVTRRRPGAPDAAEVAARVEESSAPAARGTTSTGMSITPTRGASVRTTQPVARRTAIVEGTSGPRYLTPARPILSSGDRWVLIALVMAGSVVSSALTSYLVVRGLRERGPAPTRSVVGGTVPGAPSSGAGAVSAPRPVDSATVAAHVDSALVIPTAPPLGDQRALAAAKPPAVRAPATANASRAAAARRTARPAAPPSPKPTPAGNVAGAAAAPPPSGGAADSSAASPVIIPVVPVTAPAGASGAATAPPAAAATDSRPDSAAAAASAPAPPPADLAAQLKAIRDELDQRKKRIDSLSRSLDSLKPPPR